MQQRYLGDPRNLIGRNHREKFAAEGIVQTRRFLKIKPTCAAMPSPPGLPDIPEILLQT